ncbi:hypothetical protein WA026_007245 [Henosepilachna vigintioctopunctata]|uniref:MD-2-related lipid-recognition domain-containing protein n=1 Tax=Henosepilachna vigintioctopunctata TaxID=420089 RepID=A0AAW1UX50_9CUCU
MYCMMQGRKWFEIVRFQNCKGTENLPWKIDTFKKHDYSRHNRTLDIVVKVEKETKNLWSQFDLYKCNLNGLPDTCEYYMKDFKVMNICDSIGRKGQLWSNFVDGIQPRMRCPIKPGVYQSHFSIDDEAFKFVPLPTGLWKLKSYFYQDKERLGCVNVDIRILNNPKI